MKFSSIPTFLFARTLVISAVFSFFMTGVFAQNTDQPLTISLNTGWVENNSVISNFSIGDHVPVTGHMNRNAYVYLFAIRPNGSVSLNYPANFASYNPASADNVIYGGQDQAFVRFVQTGNEQGLWTYVFLASLEPLTRADLASLNTPAALENPNLSTEWFANISQQAQVSTSSSFSQTQKEASVLWPHFQYLRDNSLIGR